MKGGGHENSSELDEEERRALRGSKFAPLSIPQSSSSSSCPQPRLAHPGGPLTTNKAAALAKFLERKLNQPGGLESINPDVLELAVKNAQETVKASCSSISGRIVRHVAFFEDDFCEESENKNVENKKKKKKKGKNGKKMKKKQEMLGGQEMGDEKIEKQDALERKKQKRKKKVPIT